ncbi:TonB-dependent siderophore receptor [Variovorax sp. MHTC-1]|uniref:TonB-dependent siderophore receptor n=1 Tax=Variovorax sp. MHTC-1 TaxID=2495593 RepID=UPI000F884C7A|nr:TonB-dependent siderophore receptor [Variovorax sp. MHTC-1]RST53044.1 TonB-dependent siderophore receptor [Variovorax sp. MHTC-1]
MRNRPRQRLLAATLAATFGSVLATWSIPSAAQAAAPAPAQVFDLQVPSQPLASALNELSRQTGAQVFAGADLLAGVSSRAVSGRLTVEQALAAMLAETRLEATRTTSGGFAIRRASEAATGATLQEIRVTATADRESATGPVAGYVAKRSATGTKTDTPIIETPQSISVVTADQMQVQKAQSLQDALGYTAGVASQVVNANPLTSDSLLLRGFESVPESGNFYRDGMRYMTTIFGGKQEPYGLERLEVIKGASSVLYGAVAPGGLINSVSKRPTLTPLRELNLEYGSFNRKQASADFGGALDENGVWSYRLTALVRDSDTPVDYTRDDRVYIAPALTWRPSAATSLTLLANYQRMRTSSSGALPAEGTLLPNPYGKLPRDRFLGEPSRNDFNNDTTSVGWQFDHAFSDTLKLHHGFRYLKSDLFNQYDLGFEPTDHRTRSRLGWTFDDRATVATTDTHLEYTLGTGAVRHTILAGFDYSRDTYDSDRRLDLLAPIDIFLPVYGKAPLAFIRDENPRRENERFGVYVQDQMKITDRWVLLLGGRQDWVRSKEKDLSQDPIGDNRKDDAFTGRAGVVYLADNGLAPYASFSQSFEPVSGSDRAGSRFKPTTGEQYEFGIRYQPKDSNMLLSAAVYDLRRQNVITVDPIDNRNSVQTGEVRSRGLELEAKASLTRNLNLIAAYSYTDARVTQSNTPEELGTRFRAPYHLFSLWADYGLGEFGLPGWRIGGGVRHSSDNPGYYNGGKATPGFTLVDLRLSYERGPMSYALNIKNLSDKTYISGECYFYGCRYGDPRTVTATVSYRW